MDTQIITNPNINVYFLKMDFISVGEFWFKCRIPVQPVAWVDVVTLWPSQCCFLHEPSLRFLQQVGPPGLIRATMEGFTGLDLGFPYVLACFVLPMYFFLWSHHSPLLQKVKTPLYLGQKLWEKFLVTLCCSRWQNLQSLHQCSKGKYFSMACFLSEHF